MLTPDEIAALQANLHRLTAPEQAQLLASLEELERRNQARHCQEDFLAFCIAVNPNYKVGAHHRRLARLLMDMEAGVTDRIGVSVPPRHGKSEMISILFPAWYLGRHPDHDIILASHTAELAVSFGRKVRNLIGSQKYGEIFPAVSLAADSKSAGRWNTNGGGAFYATGVGSALSGRGAHFLIVDDPFSEQDVLAGNYNIFEKVYEWFTYGARTRLMKDGKIAVVHTRWAEHDLIGRLANDMATIEGGDKYEFFEFPAILHEKEVNEEGNSLEKALWPEFFDLEALHRTRASMPLFQWNAQYQQKPSGKVGAIIKRDDWRPWVEPDPPKDIEYIIMAVDAAAEAHNRADFSAIATWGVFRHEQLTRGEAHIILLNVINERVEYPELKKIALREYKQWQPDCFIVEKKSNGAALYAEMRRMGIPVTEFNPSRASGDKIARLNAIADIFTSGMVWFPQGRKWAEAVIEQVAAFPASQHDDMVDVTSMALARFRSGGFLRLPSDYEDSDEVRMPQGAYY